MPGAQIWDFQDCCPQNFSGLESIDAKFSGLESIESDAKFSSMSLTSTDARFSGLEQTTSSHSKLFAVPHTSGNSWFGW